MEELSSRDGGPDKIIHESPLILPEFYDNEYDQKVFNNLLNKEDKLLPLREDDNEHLRVVNISRLIMENRGNATPPSSIS